MSEEKEDINDLHSDWDYPQQDRGSFISVIASFDVDNIHIHFDLDINRALQ